MTDIRIAIPKERLAQLPRVEFHGGIKVVDSVDMARVALRELSRHRLVGFDTETRPSFHKGRSHKVALMQLATDDFCYLFRLNKLGLIEPLRKFLENPDIAKIGLSTHDDFTAIRRSDEFEPAGFIELQDYVKRFGISDISLQKIYAIVFSETISKNQRLTNWEAPELTEHQQAYAAIDAWACLRLYKYLSEGCFDPSQSPYIVTPDSESDSQTAQKQQ